MSDDLYTLLTWLPSPPPDFAARCDALQASTPPWGKGARTLASYALDEHKLNRLGRVIDALRTRGSSLEPLTPFRLAIASNATTGFLVRPLIATAARHGIALQCTECDFDQAVQEALDPGSRLYRARPEAVLIAFDYRALPLRPTPGEAQAAEESIAAALEKVQLVRRAIRGNSDAVCILQTVARPVEGEFGSLDLTLAGTTRSLIDAFNRRLADSVAGTPDLLLDVAGLAECVGLSSWHNPTLWNVAKVPFDNVYLPLYADFACRIIAAARGKSRRCLVLDLDNTIWGGVVGDDGVEGLLIGAGDATGEAFLEVQRRVLGLRERGVVLAVASKNEDATARLPFASRPEMLLREHHFAIFQADWNDKASNIRAIAEALSLGLESLVFLDDNPAERGLIRELLPEVAVPELPHDPALFARTLLAAGYFEATRYSAEDARRAQTYRENARRADLRKKLEGVDDYLRSLDMRIGFSEFDSPGRARIAQLINKSNQYNLTTRRYTEAQIERLETDSEHATLQVRLRDAFGDNGMISVVICRAESDDWHIEAWLMSCRVLGRRVEHAVLEELVRRGKRRGKANLLGTYLPTERNRLVEDHYKRLGFELVERQAGGASLWKLALGTYRCLELPITVEEFSQA